MTTLLLALFWARVHTTVHPTSTLVAEYTSSTVCTVFTARELRHHGDHAFVCVDSRGGIIGAVVRRRGLVDCIVSGHEAEDGCVTLSACGQSQTKC